jgi:hypothetical protein
MMDVRQRLVLLALVSSMSACATNSPPETTVVHYSGTVLSAATELQKGITAATDTKILPVPTAQTMTRYIEIIYERSGPLLEGLKAYHVATTIDVRRIKAAEVQQLIAEINGAIASVLQIAIPDGAVQQVTTLVGNVISAVGAVQAEVAKSLGGSE